MSSPVQEESSSGGTQFSLCTRDLLKEHFTEKMHLYWRAQSHQSWKTEASLAKLTPQQCREILSRLRLCA